MFKKPHRRHLIRSLEFNHLFEHFLLAAMSSIIIIRLWLHLTGYPQIGGGGLHIAHMLWGGMLLMVALLGSLLFLNNDLKNIWAVLGGAGFGTFIDELGKFITKDNNYFYQPTFAIIYVIFIGLYLLYYYIWRRQHFSQDEYLLNSLEKLKEVITQEIDTAELNQVRFYLSHSDQKQPIAQFLQATFERITTVNRAKQSYYQRGRSMLSRTYAYLKKKSWFLSLVVVVLLVRAGIYLFEGSSLVFYFATQSPEMVWERLTHLRGVLPFINYLGLIGQAGLSIVGACMIWRSRLVAYHLFRNALLISIFVLQVFNFYSNPLLALFTTTRDLVLLSILEYMIFQEEIKLQPKTTTKAS